MKHTEKHIIRFLALIAVFLAFGNSGFANIKFSYGVSDAQDKVFSFQEDSQEKPYQFRAISIGEASQTISQNENFGVGLFPIFYSRQEYVETPASSTFHCFYSLKDKRELIFQYLFPFHFFW
ncbi:hypothetical protein EI546_10745 [Aequorivita sp. H23M31]|uniref:Uncharacterized protein n=1 Tax=Aequorivita ciconiae TaxID=2494375 RepID=A0A410G4K4_9FLAO|nr:hypothetical protein [Aequorivita sp. H23M31]QAA82171.1 hypothetical protein EI546_10745 [Aequorivita sp. H23M31]